MSVNGSNGARSPSQAPSLTFYTNRNCPWAHRAHIALRELEIPYEEVIVDLETPREDWYLAVNPRGTVPALKIISSAFATAANPSGEENITESATVVQFLADAFSNGTFFPRPKDLVSSLARARMLWFADTYIKYVPGAVTNILKLSTLAEKEKAGDDLVANIERHIEPHLQDAGPFFGGAAEMTLAEALTAPFAIRIWEQCDDELVPKSVKARLMSLTGYGRWAEAVCKRESVLSAYDAEKIKMATRKRVQKMRSQV